MRARSSILPGLLCCLVAWLAPRDGWAHAVSNSRLELAASGTALQGSWRVAASDLEPILALDADADGAVEAHEVEGAAGAIGAYLASWLEIEAAGVPCTTRVSEPRLDGGHVLAQVASLCPALGERDGLAVRYDLFFEHDASHQGLLQLRRGEATHGAVFTHQARTHAIAPEPPSLWRTVGGHLVHGLWHIALGHDHLAFLLTLLLPAVLARRGAFWQGPFWRANAGWHALGSARPAWLGVLRVVTAFTLAHSITLALAALGVVQPSERLIEVVIAASVVAAALHNLFPLTGTHASAFAFAFGLVHGFGFANALGELGLPKGRELAALLGFNLGVEAGQLLVVAAVLPLVLALRRSSAYVPLGLRGGSVLIAGVGLFWLFERSAADAPLAPDAEAPSAEAPGERAPSLPHLLRLSERWLDAGAEGYRPFFRARVAEQILSPALHDAWSALGADGGLHPSAAPPGAGSARAALEHGDPAPASRWFDAVGRAAAARGDRVSAARAHAHQAALLAPGAPEAAVGVLERALALDPEQPGAALLLGALDARGGRLERAEARLRELLHRLEPGRPEPARLAPRASRRVAAHASGLLADVLSQRGRWAEAERALRAALDGHSELGDRASSADDRRRLADVTLALARPREALEHYEQAIELGRSLGELRALGADCRNAAAVAQLLDDLPVAARLYRRAVESDEAQADHERARDDLVRLAQVYRQLDQFDEARACLERALAMDEAAGSHDEQIEDLAQLGNVHQLSDQLDAAEGFYRRALALPGAAQRRGDIYANLGNIHRRRGDAERAIAMYRLALSDYRGSGDAGKATRVEQHLSSLGAMAPARPAASSVRAP